MSERVNKDNIDTNFFTFAIKPKEFLKRVTMNESRDRDVNDSAHKHREEP